MNVLIVVENFLFCILFICLIFVFSFDFACVLEFVWITGSWLGLQSVPAFPMEGFVLI